MEHNQNMAIKKIKKGSTKNLLTIWKKEFYFRLKTSLVFKLARQTLGFWGVRVVLLGVVFPVIFGCGNGESKEELSFINTRLDRVEERLTRLDEIEKRLAQLEGTEEKIVHLRSLIEKLELSISEMNKLDTSMTEEERYHVVRQGDSLFKIAQEHGITVEELCFLNKITPKTVIRPGQKLVVVE
jgi:Asp-tRNA(Asn)/Glu-tRNA(Gln) amidotransferase C subunit